MTSPDLAASWLSAAGGHFDLFGAMGLGLGFLGGTMPRRNLILLVAAACSTCFGMHYMHLGALTGTAMCSISVIQGLTSAFCVGSPTRGRFVAPIFAASSLVAAWLVLTTWNGLPSACAAIGALLATCARLQAGAHTMRLFFLGASSAWVGHNLLVGSVFALTCDLLTISGMLIALMRETHLETAQDGAAAGVQAAR